MSFRPGPQVRSIGDYYSDHIFNQFLQNAQETAGVSVPAPSDTSSTTLKTAELPVVSPPTSLIPLDSTSTTSVNPWLAAGGRSSGHKRAEVAVGKNSKSADKFKDKLSKQQLRREDEREAAAEDAELEIEPDQALVLSASQPKKEKKSKGKAAAANEATDAPKDDESESDSEVEVQERQLERKGGKQGAVAFKQRDLVAMAFAGDNVVQVVIDVSSGLRILR